MTIFAKPHDSEPTLAAPSSAMPSGTRVGGAFARSAALHVGIAVLLLFTAWSLREETARDEGFVLVPTSGGASGETVVAADARRVDDAPTRPNFLTEMNRRQRAEERLVQREIERMREQRRQEEARQAAANAIPAAADRSINIASNVAPNSGRPTTSYREFQRTNSLPRDTVANAPAENRRAPGVDWREVVKAGDVAREPGPAGPGSATTQAEGLAMGRYFDDLLARLRAGHEKPGGLDDLLSAEVEFSLAADGAISALRIVRPSGNAAFDQSVLDACARVRLPARPDGKRDVRRVTFRMRDT